MGYMGRACEPLEVYKPNQPSRLIRSTQSSQTSTGGPRLYRVPAVLDGIGGEPAIDKLIVRHQSLISGTNMD